MNANTEARIALANTSAILVDLQTSTAFFRSEREAEMGAYRLFEAGIETTEPVRHTATTIHDESGFLFNSDFSISWEC